MAKQQTIVEITKSLTNEVVEVLSGFGARHFDNDTLIEVDSDDKEAIYSHMELAGYDRQFFNVSE